MSSGKPSARLGDQDTGHGIFPPTPITSGAATVMIGGKPAARLGDTLAPHHPGVRVIAAGSGSVTIEGKPAARLGDPINCGGVIAIGESSVLIGDAAPSLAAAPLSAAFSEFVQTMLNPATKAHSPEEIQTLKDKITIKYEPRFPGDTVGRLKAEHTKAAADTLDSPSHVAQRTEQPAPTATQLTETANTSATLDIKVSDANGQPAINLPYRLTQADNAERQGRLNQQGQAKETALLPGNVTVLIGDAPNHTEIRQQRAAVRETLSTALQQARDDAQARQEELSKNPSLSQQSSYQKTGLRGLWNGALGLMSTAENQEALQNYVKAVEKAWPQWMYTNVTVYTHTFNKAFSAADCQALAQSLSLDPATLTPATLGDIAPLFNFLWHDEAVKNHIINFVAQCDKTQKDLNVATTVKASNTALACDVLWSALLLQSGASLINPPSLAWLSHLRELGSLLKQFGEDLKTAALTVRESAHTNTAVSIALEKPNHQAILLPETTPATHQAALRICYPNGKPYPLAASPAAMVNGALCHVDASDAQHSEIVKQQLSANDDVTFQLWDDAIEQQQAALRSDIQQQLDALLAETQAETARKNALFFQEDRLTQGALLGGALLTGAGEGAMGIVEFIDMAAKNWYDLQRMTAHLVINAVQTGWEKYIEGDEGAFFDSLADKNVDDFASIYGVTPAQIKKHLTQAYEIFNFIKADSELWEIFFEFSKSYAMSLAVTDYVEFAGAFLFDLILAILLAVFTGGAGNLAQASAKITHADKLVALAKLIKEYVKLSKQKLAPKQVVAALDDVTTVTVKPPTAAPLSRPATPPPDAPDSPNTQGTLSQGTAHSTTHDAPGTNKNGEADQPLDCTPKSGCPISLITGEEILSQTDFSFPGPLGLAWSRTYRSSNATDQDMGFGWSHSFSDVLIIKGQRVALSGSDARLIQFHLPAVGHDCTNRTEKLRLRRISETRFLISSTAPGVQTTKHFDITSNPTRLNLIKISDPFDNHVDLHYTHGRLTRIDTVGHYWQLHYRDNHITSIRWHTPSGYAKTVVRYDYDDQHDLVRAEDPAGNSERYAYRNHLITRRTLKSGYRFHFEWDTNDSTARCLRNWGDDIDGQPTYNYRFLWDKTNRKVTVTDTRGGCTTSQFNAKGQQIYGKLPEGGETVWTFDRDGNLTQIEDALGGLTHYAYDNKQQLQGVTGKLGERTQLARDETGNVTGIVDPLGSRWQRRFNKHGQVTEQINPLGESVHYRYNRMGLISTLTDPKGQQWHYIWDNEARLLAVKNPAGQQTRYSYNELGNLTKIVWPDGQTKSFKYDDADRCTQILYPDGKSESFAYNPLGLVTQYRDKYNRTTCYEYNGLSQVIRRVDPAGQTLEYSYDGERNLVGLTNEKGERYRLSYDLDERLTEEIGFDQRIQRYEYNALGHLIASTDVSPDTQDQINKLIFHRDAHGRLCRQVDALTGDVLGEYTHDENGRLSEAKNSHRTLRWRYDALGRVIEDWQDEHLLSHHYANGHRTHSTLPEGAQLTYHYTLQGEFKALDYDGIRISDIERDAMGRELKRTLSNAIVTESQYDPQGRLIRQTSQKHSGAHSPDTVSQRQYHYNTFGQLAQIDDQLRGSTQYHYDVLDRLTHVDGPQPETFIHDPAGNLLATQATTETPAATGNRLPFHGDTHFSYDARGNRIKAASGKDQQLVTHYQYDALNQLVAVQKANNTVHYAYDALGRRIHKISNDTRTDFLWFEDVLLNEATSSSDGSEISALKTYLYEPGTFKPLAFVENDKIFHYHLDHLGTPQEITNEQGEVVWAVSFKAYGNLAVAHTQSIENNIRFQGQYYDHETGLHYNRFRYYDPSCGRFVNQDPIKLLGGNNNYQYAPNPVSWIDPLGLMAKELDCPKNKKTTYYGDSRHDAFRQAKQDARIPLSQQPSEISRIYLDDGNGNFVLDKSGSMVEVRQYHYTNIDGDQIVIQEHSLGHSKATPGHGLEPHFNVRPIENTRTGHVPGTHGHYNF